MVLAAQSRLALYFPSQFIPNMASKSVELKAISGNGKGNEPILIETSGVTLLVCQRVPGLVTYNGASNSSNGILFRCANAIEMNECDAPESNSTVARIIQMSGTETLESGMKVELG